MAAVHGTRSNSLGNEHSAIAHQTIVSMVETWDVRIITTLDKDGKYTVTITDRDTGVVVKEVKGHYSSGILHYSTI